MVGSGVSAAYTLIHYLELLRQNPSQGPVRLVILERSGEFWAGVPYGRRSGRHSLIITALKEFLPEPERGAFTQWLDRNRGSLFEPAEVDGCSLTSQWRRANAGAMAAGNWDDLFIPRGVFGIYLQQTMAVLLEDAAKAGLVEYVLVTAEVRDVEREGGRFRLAISGDDLAPGPVLTADKVVLALGSPPNRCCGQDLPESARHEVCVVENVYEPGLDENLAAVGEFLSGAATRGRDEVLIVGSNASALEVLYSLTDLVERARRIRRFIVLSPAARFPHRIGGGNPPPGYRAVHLESLLKSQPFTAGRILECLGRDVEAAEREGLKLADLFQVMSRGVVDTLNALSPEEQHSFVIDHGVKIGKLQRRAGPEYRDVVDRLLAEQRLELLKGEFVRYVPEGAGAQGGPGCAYLETGTRLPKVHEAPLAAIINCGGFADVSEWPSPLLQNLIRRGLCTPNASRRGFLLNEAFEASPDCHVMGPLVAGNLNGAIRVWHAESCSRIISLSRQLAQALHLRLSPNS